MERAKESVTYSYLDHVKHMTTIPITENRTIRAASAHSATQGPSVLSFSAASERALEASNKAFSTVRGADTWATVPREASAKAEEITDWAWVDIKDLKIKDGEH